MERAALVPQNDLALHPPPPIRPSERVLQFINHGSTQTVAGIVGGLVGTLLDGRYFALLGIWATFAIRDSLDRINRRWVLPIHILAVAVASSGLFCVGVEINKHRPETYTPDDYAKAVKKGTSLPITQQITNIYNEIHPPAPPQPPSLNFDNPRQLRRGFFNIRITNTGGQKAIQVATISHGVVSDGMDINAENSMFEKLKKQVRDPKISKGDLSNNQTDGLVAPVLVPMSSDDQSALSANQKVIYIALITRYKDSAGHYYSSEGCWIYVNPDSGDLPLDCLGHNQTYRTD